MPVFAGRILHRDVSEGWIEVNEGRIVDLGDGQPPSKPVATGWIIPAPVNAHTHVGDAFLRDEPGKPKDVAGLVGPGGWKHRHLATAEPEAQAAGVERYVGEMAAIGTRAFIDFREGGAGGAHWLRSLDLPVEAIIHGRPTGSYDGDAADDLFAAVDGIGFSGIRDIPRGDLEEWVDAIQDARLPWGIHVSEDRRDNIETVLSLEPSYVVHMTQGTKRDFEALADADVPIVACPRSNAWFGMQAPVKAMLKADCKVALGTDNGMLQTGDLTEEAKALSDQVQGVQLLRMLTAGRDIAGIPTEIRRGAAADLIVLPDEPFVTRSKPTLAPNLDPQAWRAHDA